MKISGMLFRKLFFSILVLVSVLCLQLNAAEDITPVFVTQTKGSVSGTYHARDIIRTSTGRLYYFLGNKNILSTGWLEVFTSPNGDAWSYTGTIKEWLDTADISVAIDSKNVIHVITYDWDKRPFYLTFNTLDSPSGDHSWKGYELIENDNSSTIYNCSIAVDANDNPHVVYRLYESYKGKNYQTLYYANKTGGVWNKKSLWPKENKESFYGKFDISIGPDNVPYILMGNKVLKGNANNPTAFEEKDLGPIYGYGLLIHQNGDVRVALTNNTTYAHYVHDYAQPWSSGWTLYDSGNRPKGSLVTLVDDVPYLVYLENGGLWVQKNFETPVLLGTQPPDTVWTNVFAKGHFYHNHFPGMLDIGIKSYDSCWYGKLQSSVQASFSASPPTGISPLTVDFTDNSIIPPDGSIVAWQWDFNNDGVIDSIQQNPSFLYTEPGSYTVLLTVTDSHGETNTRTYASCVEVRGMQDADRDGVVDAEDNCLAVFNPQQVDLDGDGMGDECDDSVDLSFQSFFTTGLKTSLSDEKRAQDVTIYMEDTLTDQGFRVQSTSRTSDVLSFGINVEANQLAGAMLYVYVNEIFGTQFPPVTVWNYNTDGISVQTYLGLNGYMYPRWNYINVTPLLSQMGGLGFIKFRLSTNGSGFSISEGYFVLIMDNLTIRVSPPEPDFGSVEIGDVLTSTLTVWNSGPPTLIIQEIFPPSGPFTIESDGCSGRMISEPCSVTVKFAPGTPGLFHDTMTILSNDADTPHMRVDLAGTAAEPSNVLTGKATDSLTAIPLPEVRVTVTDILGTHTAVTDSLGIYTITGLAKGTYMATFAKVGYSEKTLNGIIEPGQNILHVGLSPLLATLTGVISDGTTGMPLAGVTVTVTDAAARISSTTSDANGSYVLPDLAPGNFAASFEKPGYIKGTSTGTLIEAETRIFNISLAPLLPLVLTITSPVDGAVVNSSWLTVSGTVSNNANVSVNGTQASMADGLFSVIIPLKEGSNTITATATDGYGQTVSQSITVTLSGLLDQEELFVSPMALDFGAVTVGALRTLTIQISNIGTANLNINKISVSPPFLVFDDECSWQILPASSACTVKVKFAPTVEGDFSGTLNIPSSDGDRPFVVIPLTGTAVLSMSGYGYLLPDTGQADCFDSSGTIIICSPAPGQDGWYMINPLSYVGDSPWTVTDENTGLMWQREDDGMARTWNDAGDYCEALDLDGYSDWRLPTYFELLTIVDYGRSNPSIDPLAFPNANPSYYWSSVTDGGGAKAIRFDYGGSSTLGQSSVNSVRCVRGGTLPIGHFSENYDGTLTDWDTGLMWTKDFYSARTWNQALYLCNVMEVGGYTDWRLPDIKELLSKTYTDCYFGDCFAWSSTTFGQPDATGNYTQAFVYDNADIIPHEKSNTHFLRCVRGGWGTFKGMVKGTVTDSVTGIPVPSANISLTDSLNATQTVLTDADGAYAIADVSVGDFTVIASKAGYSSQTLPGALGPGQAVIIDATLTKHFVVNTLGDYGNVTVFEITGDYSAKNPDGSINAMARQEIAKEYLRIHGDEYDFFVVFTNFDFAMPDADAQAFYLEVKNDIQGIGKQIFDNSNLFGSNSRLQGMVDMGNIAALVTNPIDLKFEETVTLLAHEQLHRWAANVKFKDTAGNISAALLGKDASHWSFLLDSGASVMYGNDWRDNGDGTFTSVAAAKYYSPLDLYLMGILDKAAIPPMLLIDNPAVDPARMPEVGAVIAGTHRYIAIDDIILAEGERVPDASTSQKAFRTAFLFITRPGTFTGNELPGIENIINAWAGRFRNLTYGKASIADIAPSITTAICSPSDGETITRPDVMVKGAIINSTGNETGVTVNGIVATVYGNQFIANHVPLVDGVNTITITVRDTEGNTATTSIAVNAVTTGNYIKLTSNIESGVSPLEVSLRIDSTFSITESGLSITGPVHPEIISSTPDEYTVTMTIEGIYYLTATATGPDGLPYQDTICIIVLNRTQMDTLLRGKWEGMKSELVNQNIGGALNDFHESSKESYRQAFNLLMDELPQIVSGMQNIEMIYQIDDVAKYRINRVHEINGASCTITYYIYFVKDKQGVWRINKF